MGNLPLLSFTCACILCFSFYASSSASSLSYQKSELQTDSTLSSTPKATFGDLVNLLGTPEQVSLVDPEVAKQLRSCFKSLVPPLHGTMSSELFNASNPIEMVTSKSSFADDDDEEGDNIKIWFPPEAIMKMARLFRVPSYRTMYMLLNHLDIKIPDVEGSKKAKCMPTALTFGNQFLDEGLNQYLEFLFKLIVKRGPRIGLNVGLSRFDLFHGFILHFGSDPSTQARLGILFHAKEYPAKDDKYPVDLGSCQTGSSVKYDASQMNLRNILWLAPYISRNTWSPGALLALDARPDGIIYRDLIREENQLKRTIFEGDLGLIIPTEANYLNVGKPGKPRYELYIS